MVTRRWFCPSAAFFADELATLRGLLHIAFAALGAGRCGDRIHRMFLFTWVCLKMRERGEWKRRSPR